MVVPLHPSHEHLLPELFADLMPSNGLISEIIVCRGHSPTSTLRDVRLRIGRMFEASGLTSALYLDLTSEPRTAGQNKNAGWLRTTAPWTAFVDADDRYHPQRLHRLCSLAEDGELDFILHAFVDQTDAWQPLGATPLLVDPSVLYAMTFPGGRRERHNEGTRSGDTNIEVPLGCGPVHHGHVLVNTDLRSEFRFSNLARGEDGQLARDVLWAGKNVSFLDEGLSCYRPQHSTLRNSALRRLKGAWDYRVGKVLHRAVRGQR